METLPARFGVTVFYPISAQNVNDVDEIHSLLKKVCVALKFKECAFLKPIVDYMGHKILPGRLAAASALTKSIM